MRLKLISVGKDRPGEFTAAGVAEYAQRIRRFAELELCELKPEAGAQAKEKEADAILAASRKGAGASELWALDERGTEVSSVQLAERLSRVRDASLGLSLCIGGDEGLSPRVREAARFTWSLSRLTLPHRLARVVVLEQVYRAFEILRGGPYHK